MFCHPRVVQTGLDLIEFPTLVWLVRRGTRHRILDLVEKDSEECPWVNGLPDGETRKELQPIVVCSPRRPVSSAVASHAFPHSIYTESGLRHFLRRRPGIPRQCTHGRCGMCLRQVLATGTLLLSWTFVKLGWSRCAQSFLLSREADRRQPLPGAQMSFVAPRAAPLHCQHSKARSRHQSFGTTSALPRRWERRPFPRVFVASRRSRARSR